MTRNRFVTPRTIRLELSDGDWIEVKERLTYGEQQRLGSGAFEKVSRSSDGSDIEFRMNMERYSILRMSTWIVDWSFTDERGKPVAVSQSAIAALDPDTADEIDAALTAHIEALEAEKNANRATATP